MPELSRKIIAWYQQSGRHGLPWQKQTTPYRIWISEIMLQQTQVATVIPYFQRFTENYADVKSLARADLDDVLHLWTGLGYYSRARNLHKTAQIIYAEYKGVFPKGVEKLIALPGIGRSTAGAILALAFNLSYPILDGNVKRVLARYHGISGWPGRQDVEKKLWQLSKQHTPGKQVADYTQGIMDLGATICTRSQPSCDICPISSNCYALRYGLQRELPHKKPKRILPVRKTKFALIERRKGEILLERRPPSGIWGGLWGFPECPVDMDISIWIKNKFGYEVEALQNEPELQHTFSHFQLNITPVRMKLKSVVDKITDERELYWFQSEGNNKSIGMAAPVKKLVENFCKYI